MRFVSAATVHGGFGGVGDDDDHVVGPVRPLPLDNQFHLGLAWQPPVQVAIVFGCRLSQLVARSLEALALGTDYGGELVREGEGGPLAPYQTWMVLKSF